MAISAGIVALAEPGAARAAAGGIGASLFLTLVFGFARAGEDSKVVLVRELLVFCSKSQARRVASVAALAVVAVGAVVYGPSRTDFIIVNCLDAKRISRRAVPGRRVEECGPDRNATFTAWYPWGRPSLDASIICHYASGDTVRAVPVESTAPAGPPPPPAPVGAAATIEIGTRTCPVHEFAYARIEDHRGYIMHWSRGLDGWWLERGNDDNFTRFMEIGLETIDTKGPDGTPASGMVVQRVPDSSEMRMLIPYTTRKDTWIYTRNTPKDAWRFYGTAVSPP